MAFKFAEQNWSLIIAATLPSLINSQGLTWHVSKKVVHISKFAFGNFFDFKLAYLIDI